MKKINAREAAYLAALAAAREECFAHDYLNKWREADHPTPQDYHLAQEIAFGTVRMALALDYLALQLTEKGKINLKLKEKILLRTALYQHIFLERIPLYAIVNETIAIAKKHFYQTFIGFLNALLRKLESAPPSLPQGDSVKELSIRYSYPEYFVERLLRDYDLVTTKSFLEEGNTPPCTTVRIRNPERTSELDLIIKTPFLVGRLPLGTSTEELALSPDFYIQNTTPATLLGRACQQTFVKAPETVLDLCAAPGGKIIAVHDLYPEAKLFANDISPSKIKMIAGESEEVWNRGHPLRKSWRRL